MTKFSVLKLKKEKQNKIKNLLVVIDFSFGAETTKGSYRLDFFALPNGAQCYYWNAVSTALLWRNITEVSFIVWGGGGVGRT